MGLSKTHRLIILLAVDAVFCAVELGTGYAVHSLALVADAFHMLNDVLSLCVGLWAVKRAKTGRTKNYTYGWQRAETLGALVNGVFLIALCLSIFLEAIQRFFEPQVVTNPKMVLIVGCLGLASNILGLFLFSDHGHSHGGGHSHSHSHSHNPAKNAEEGHAHGAARRQGADETTRLLDNRQEGVKNDLSTAKVTNSQGTGQSREFTRSDESSSTTKVSDHTSSYRWQSAAGGAERHRRRASFFSGSIDDMPTHPAGRRDTIINASHLDFDGQSDTHTEEGIETDEDESPAKASSADGKTDGYGSVQPRDGPRDSHAAHKHRQPREQKTGGGGHGHSHGDLNMQGVFLHVLGDALGNVGVIASALIIWLAKFPQRYYADPAISLIITLIILKTAIPLCQAAARILLQAVPMGMKIDEIRADIEDLEGVTSAHHIHVWQLSDTKLVASLHVRIAPEIKNPGSEGYMRLAREIQLCLREYGIRSSTIQPEFECALEAIEEDDSSTSRSLKQPATNTKLASSQANLQDGKECMLDCEDAGEVLEQEESHHSHDHSHEHNHDHSHSHDTHDHEHDHGSDNGNGKNKHNHQH